MGGKNTEKPSQKNETQPKLENIHLEIPNDYLKKINSQVIAEFYIPEEVEDLGDGAELILREGKTIALVQEEWEFKKPQTNNLIPEKVLTKKSKKSKK